MNRSELQAKIDNLKAEIQKEEQIKRGAESMQAAWMGSKGNSDTYLKSKENVDACIKNIREKTAEVERLSAALLIAPEVDFCRCAGVITLLLLFEKCTNHLIIVV